MTQQLDFSSPQHEAMALIRMLRATPLDMTRGRSEGVAELLERLVILTNDARESDGIISCKAQVPAIGSRILARTSRSERTIQRWTSDAKDLGLLKVDYSSQHYGGHQWNTYRIDMHRLRTLLNSGRHGATRGDTVSGLGGDTVSGLGGDTVSGLGGDTVSGLKQRSNNKEETTTNSQLVVVSLLETLGLRDPARTYSQARQSLQLTDEQILERVAVWRELPAAQRLPGTIYNWLTKRNSFEPRSDAQPKLHFRKLGNCTDENTRAKLIQYGRKQGWSLQQIQSAVTRFEDEKLSNSQTMEPMPCNHQPQPQEA